MFDIFISCGPTVKAFLMRNAQNGHGGNDSRQARERATDFTDEMDKSKNAPVAVNRELPEPLRSKRFSL
jgi:hypothetical protein